MAGTPNPSPSLSQGRAMGRTVVSLLRGYVEGALASVAGRIDLLQKQVSEAPTRDAIRAEVDRAVKRAALSFEPGSISAEEIRPAIEAELLRWQVDFERRAADVMERAIARIPAPRDGLDGANGRDGAPGRDGFSLESFTLVTFDEGRTLRLSFEDSFGKSVHRELRTAFVIDRGVYEMGRDYEKGDGVTYGGSYWIAQKDTKERPGVPDAWRLAVKRGRDGKDAGKGGGE